MYACMQGFIPACKPARSHAIKHAGIHIGQHVLRQCSITNKKKDIFPKETEKRKKEKESNLKRTGYRQAKRNRNKSRRVSCELRARHYAEVFLPD
ncbi:hypothetical protein EAH81_27025 [Flavobacterium pectinovorum]|uniref:Uncharacterized protein n=1 Tax=Flavobacterium pectinovorum TaxID=29533 RepID=A0A502E1W5_9FLAO|nr:hypothetical protein EAH81_27025 [Flavobacterium pectinovorum]